MSALQRRVRTRRAAELLEARRSGSARLRRGRAARTSWRRRGHVREDRLAGGARRPPTSSTGACEITGPVDRKMMINALNSGARVFMADFEDANSPTWENASRASATCATRCDAHDLARDAGGKTLQAERRDRDAAGAAARLAPAGEARARSTASRSRPRCSTSGSTSSTTRGSCWRAAAGPTSTCPSSRATSRRGSGTTSSARRGRARLPPGTIRATVLIETILAAFEMEEILYELREHCRRRSTPAAGTTSSASIKKFRDDAELRAARPRPGDDDRAVHARLHASCS